MLGLFAKWKMFYNFTPMSMILIIPWSAFIPAEARRILDKLEFHYTPKHGSWLNMAEIELSVLTRQCLDRRIPDKNLLKQEVAAWEERRNQISCKADWQFTTVDARIKLKRLYPSISS